MEIAEEIEIAKKKHCNCEPHANNVLPQHGTWLDMKSTVSGPGARCRKVFVAVSNPYHYSSQHVCFRQRERGERARGGGGCAFLPILSDHSWSFDMLQVLPGLLIAPLLVVISSCGYPCSSR